MTSRPPTPRAGTPWRGSGCGSPESIQAFDLGETTHRSQIRHEARQAAGHDVGLEAGS